MKVLHILYQSLPNISGSSIRSRDILSNQLKIGIKPIVISDCMMVKHESTFIFKPDNLQESSL